ncbi:MAG: hypothetical protein R3F37_16330 [Candidatus Competibacteraceae bacterium]
MNKCFRWVTLWLALGVGPVWADALPENNSAIGTTDVATSATTLGSITALSGNNAYKGAQRWQSMTPERTLAARA